MPDGPPLPRRHPRTIITSRLHKQAPLARIVVPQVAHHATQRGDRRVEVFSDEDYAACLYLVAEACRR